MVAHSAEKDAVGPGSGREFDCHSTNTTGLRTLGSGRVQRLTGVWPCDCELGMELPACISEFLRFLEWGERCSGNGSLLSAPPTPKASSP